MKTIVTLSACLTLALAGCAGTMVDIAEQYTNPTPYRTEFNPFGSSQGTRAEEQSSGVFVINTRANLKTSRETMREYNLLKAAEIASQSGHPFFTIIDEKEASKVHYVGQKGSGYADEVAREPISEITVRFSKEGEPTMEQYKTAVILRELGAKYLK